jgi:ferrous iron transport protein B
MEEKVSRQYVAREKPDVIINVVDATVLERNLFFTLQLIEMGVPLVIALNQVDEAEKKGIKIDAKKLSQELGVPVVPTVATKSIGVKQMLFQAIKVAKKDKQEKTRVGYCKEIEGAVEKMEDALKGTNFRFPNRWTAVKLLEGDPLVKKEVSRSRPEIVEKAVKLSTSLKKTHGKDCGVSISSGKYCVAARIAKKVTKRTSYERSLLDVLDEASTHPLLGYPILLAVVLAVFLSIFYFGDFLSGQMESVTLFTQQVVKGYLGEGVFSELAWSAFEGVFAGLTIALPYIIPFYIVLSLLEDSGYLSRAAFLVDNLMHLLGLHGKAFIPLILGYGCNVPACLSCRIMERYRERFMTAFLVTLVPCAAVTVIIMGLVAHYVGIEWALFLYVLNLAVIFVMGKALNHLMPGEPVGLIMEMHSYRTPSVKNALHQAWSNVKEFIRIAFPIIIASSVFITLLDVTGLLAVMTGALKPITVDWLGFPVQAGEALVADKIGVILIFGVLRKELILVMLKAMLDPVGLAEALTPLQMITLAVVSMFYVPCVATIAAVKKEFGWRKATHITIFEIVFALVFAGLLMRVLAALGLP